MWTLDEHNNIGSVGKDGVFMPRHRYDTVFGKQVRVNETAGTSVVCRKVQCR